MDHPQYLALSMDTLRINNATDDSTVAFATSSTVILGINLRRLRGDGVSRRCFSLRLLDLNGNAD